MLDDVLPILHAVTARDAAILMAMLGIYKIVFTHPKLGITKDLLATKVLPFLIPISVDSNLNIKQCTAYMALIKDMLNQIETEHKKKMEQIEAMEREKSIIPYTFANSVGSGAKPQEVARAAPNNTMMDQLMMGYGVNSVNGSAPPPGYSGEIVMSQTSGGSALRKELSLKEKQELASKLENEQPQVIANSMSLNNFNKPRDMADTLMSKNLADLSPKKSSAMLPSASLSSSSTNFDLLTQFSSPSNTSNPSFNPLTSQQIKPPFNNNNNNSSHKSNMNRAGFAISQNNQNNSMNLNGSEFVGFFGNLALPAPPPTTSSISINQMASNFQTLSINTTAPMTTTTTMMKPPLSLGNNTMSIPLIPMPPKSGSTPISSNSNSSSNKKSALDDLTDIFG